MLNIVATEGAKVDGELVARYCGLPQNHCKRVLLGSSEDTCETIGRLTRPASKERRYKALMGSSESGRLGKYGANVGPLFETFGSQMAALGLQCESQKQPSPSVNPKNRCYLITPTLILLFVS